MMESLPAQTSTSRKWYEIWWAILRYPGKETFRSILQEPNTNYVRGFIWTAVVTLITSLVISLASLPLIRTLPGGSSDFFVNSSIFIVILVLEVILAPFLAVAGMALMAAIYHGIARLFGGMGQWGQLVFCLAAISAPFALLSAAINLVTLPFTAWFPSDYGSLVSCCVGPFALALGIYALVLQITAIDAVENIGSWKSVATFFIPAIILVVLSICCSLTILVPLLSSYLPDLQ
jgi:hypothetical protein